MTTQFPTNGILYWPYIHEAPSTPGLYAWYMRPTLREADLTDIEATKSNLLRLCELLRWPTMKVVATGHLSFKTSGTLQHRHLGSKSKGRNQLSELVERVLVNPDQRALFANALSLSVPLLLPPLYVGVASDLQQRLLKHKRLLQKGALKPTSTPSPEYFFAKEVNQRGISLGDLVVCFREFEASYVKIEDLRTTIEAVETILNRMFYPILGRR